MSNDSVVQLLTVLESANDAEHISNFLAKAGTAVRTVNVNTVKQFQNILKQQTWDIIISSYTLSEIDANEVLDTLKESEFVIPVIIITDDFNEKTQAELLQSGARNYLPSNNQGLLLLAMLRELSDLNVRRKLVRVEKFFKESEKRIQLLIDSSRDAIAYIHEGMHIHSNSAYLEMFKYDSAEDLAAVPIMDMISRDDAKKFKGILRMLSAGKNPKEQFEFTAVRSDDETFNAVMTFAPASIDDEPCTQIIIKGNHELEEQIEALRRQDLLTSLYNRNYFVERLDQEIQTATSDAKYVSGVVLHIDLDGFKAISEKIGIVYSDKVLREFANIILACISENDVAARFVGDIFTLLLNKMDINKATKVAEAIRTALCKHSFDIQDESFSCTASIGITQISTDIDSSIKALSNAEAACKVAKSNGGNTLYAYTLADEKATDEKDRKWVQLINNALKQDLFYLLYQPIVELKGEKGARYEVIVHLENPESEQVSPNQFMTVAAEMGLLTEIDRWVIKNSIKDILSSNKNFSTQLFIKISPESIREKSFLVWLSKLIKSSNLPANRLVFELSESAIIKSIGESKAFVTNLGKLGCGIAINHAGHGKELIAFLKILEAKYLKIDPFFTSSLTTSEQSQNAVQTITDTAKKNGILSIAEKVDDAETVAIIWQSEIDLVQGDYLQAPDKAMSYDFTAES